jgi:hypothetical protein
MTPIWLVRLAGEVGEPRWNVERLEGSAEADERRST